MTAPVLADETNIEGYLKGRGKAESFENSTGVEGPSVSEQLSNAMTCAPYAEANERCKALLRSLPSLDSAVRYRRVWSIPEALEQYGSLTKQRDILVEAGKNRLKARRMQKTFAELEAREAKALLLAQQEVAPACQTAALAKRVTSNLVIVGKTLEVEVASVDEQLDRCAKEVESSRAAMAALKEAADDPTMLPVPAEVTMPIPPRPKGEFFYCGNCKVGGHGQRFSEYLLKRPNWRVYPSQVWFKDEKGKEYFCPLGKKLIDFTDETKFSRISMYIRGHIWMEDKTKLFDVVPEIMPDTWVIDDLKWRNGREPPADDTVSDLPWFVKEADRNFGTSIHMCRKPSECMSFAKPGAIYAVQQHIKDPLCLDDGRKCHIKFYILLMCHEDGKTWELYTYKNGYLSISPTKWDPLDIAKETQVTIIRSERIESWKPWPIVYPKCKEGVAEVVRRLVTQGKLIGTPGRVQFEIMSADYIVDTNHDVFMFEFNTSPVLKDPQDSPDVHDADLIVGALAVIIPYEGGSPGLWDHALKIEAPEPTTEPADAVAAGN